MNRNKLFAESFTHFEPTEENISVVEWLAEQMPGGLFIYRADEDGEILYVNSSVCDIFGCESVEEFRELTGNTFKGMVHPEDYDTIHDSIDDQIAQLDNKRNNDYVAYRIIRKDGEVRWVDDFGHFAMLPGYGEVYYVFISDITEKKLAEEEMEKAETLKLALKQAEEANEAKIAFLSNMSHEIRTPITAILGMNEMIQREAEKEEILEYSENIRKAGVSLLGIISDILDFSKIDSGHMELEDERYSLKSMIGDLYNLVTFRAEAKGLGLDFLIDPNLPEALIGDEIRIKQVISNLLTNAVKYTEKGAVILEIKMEKKLPGAVRIGVSVNDTGIGIREEDMERLFEPFERMDLKKTRSIEGTGLGLAITRKILALVDSDLQVESTYGKGSKFFFSFTQKVAEDTPIGEVDVESLIHSGPGKARKHALFTAPGFTDYLPKPVNVDEMERMMIRYLPADSVVIQGEENSEEEDMITGLPEEIYEYPQLNAVKGVGYCGDVEDYMFALETYEKSIDARADQIEKDLKENNIEGFTMDVHSLKSTSGAIGATHLSEKAKELEMAGKEKNYDLLKKETPGLLKECREMNDILHRILEVYHAEEARAIRESLAERRILITEDMNIDAQIIRQVLRLRNMEADIASNGEEALRYFSENEPGYYAAILMDRHMPVMDGLQAAGKIRKLDRPDAGSIPIIALTGSSSVEDEEDSFAAGMNAHLVKPVEPDALFEVLEKLILGAK